MIKFSLSLFGIGYISKFPGTIASLVTCIIFYFLWAFIGIKNILIPVILFLLIVFFVSIILINKVFGDRDSKEIVVDEFIGQSIPIILYELFHSDRANSNVETLQIYFWFFLLFRLFDGLKPFPIDYIDKKYKNTFGIIFDDILAGFYVVICLVLYMVGKSFFF